MADNPFDKYKNFSDVMLRNVWGKRAQGFEITPIDWSRPVKHEDVFYLVNRYPFLQMISSNPSFEGEMQVKLHTAKSGWVIHDYGDAMSSSPGELLFGNYSVEKKEEDEGGEGSGTTDLSAGKGTVYNQAVMTAQEMIELAIQKGWPGVEIIDGTELMKWGAWMAAEDNKFSLGGYEPTAADKRKRERLRRTSSEITPTPGKRMR